MNGVLYYPFLCPTAEWLKMAGLCWDTVYRIKPYDTPDDVEDVKKIDTAFGGILRSISPFPNQHSPREEYSTYFAIIPELREKLEAWAIAHSGALESTLCADEWARAENYIGLSRSKISDPSLYQMLQKRGLIDNRLELIEGKQRNILLWDLLRQTQDSELEPENGDVINAEYEMFTELRERGYALKKQGRTDEGSGLIKQAVEIRERNRVTVPDFEKNVYVPLEVAYHYLALMASLLATKLNLDLAADGEKYVNTVLNDVRAVRGDVMTTVLTAYLPDRFNELPLSRLAEFRDTFKTQRLRYEKEIQSTVKEFSDVASEGQLNSIKKQIADIAIERVEETKKTYRRAKVEMVAKTFGLSIAPPALIASLSSALGIGLFAPMGITAALASLGITKWLEWQKATSEKNKSPWSYVLASSSLTN